MKTFKIQGFTRPDYPFIGINTGDDVVTVFEPGDESTPEWIAQHPAPDPVAAIAAYLVRAV